MNTQIRIKLLSFFIFLLLSACSTTTKNNFTQRNITASQINVQLGLAYLERSDMPKAKEKLLLAVQEDPKSTTALDALAYFWETTGLTQLANTTYQKAVKLDPRSGRVLNNYGVFLCRFGDRKEGMEYLLKAASQFDYTHTAQAYENAGLCALEMKDYNHAIFLFNQALKQEPERRTSLFALSKLYIRQNRPKMAKKILLRYLKIAPIDAQSLWLSIQIANQLHDEANLASHGRLLLAHFPKSREAIYYREMRKS